MAFWSRSKPTPEVVTAAPRVPRHVGGGRQVVSAKQKLTNTSRQAEIRRYDDEGPGFVGQYLDTRSHLGTQAKTVVKLRGGRSHDWTVLGEAQQMGERDQFILALVMHLFNAFRNNDQEPLELMFDMQRALSGVAECALGYVPGYGAVVAQQPELQMTSTGWTWTNEAGQRLPFVKPQRAYTYARGKGNRREPYSHLMRALPDIRRYVMSVHGQMRPIASRLVANGMVRLPVSRNPEASDDIFLDMIESADADTQDLRYLTSAPDPRRHMPLMYEGDEVMEWIDMGRSLDQGLLVMETRAVEAFARSVPMPLKLILEGPGAAKYANEDTLLASFLRQDIQPLVNTSYGYVNRQYLRPKLREMVRKAHADTTGSEIWKLIATINPDDVALSADVESMILPTNNGELGLEAYKMGLVDGEDVARSLGLAPLRRPGNVSAYEHFLRINGSWTGDGKPGNNVRPAPAPAIDPGTDATQAPLPKTAAVVIEAPVELPALPPAMTDRPGDLVALERALRDIDAFAIEHIADWMTANVEATAGRLAALMMREVPKDDPDRIELRDSAPKDIFKRLTERVDVARLASGLAEEWDTDELKRVITRTHTRVAGLELDAADPDIPAALRCATAHGARLLALSTRRAPLASQAATEVLMAAGGATLAADGTLDRTAEGDPFTAGVRWRGGTGYAVGHKVAGALRARGYMVDFEWLHSAVRTPMQPSAHASLNGEVRGSADAVQWGETHPGAHSMACSCVVALKLSLAQKVPA